MSGGFSKYQFFMFCVAGALPFMALCWIVLSDVFIMVGVKKDWDITDVQVGLVSTWVFAGWTVGAFLGAMLADKIGRKPVFYVLDLTMILFTAASVFTNKDTYWLMCLLRFGSGFSLGGCGACGYVLMIEFMPGGARANVTTSINLVWACATMMLAGIASIIRDNWRVLTLVVCIPATCQLLFYFSTPESPRYHFVHGRPARALAILRHAARKNGKPLSTDITLSSPPSRSTNQAAGSALDLLAPSMRWKTLASILCWFASAMVFYGLSFAAGSLAGSLYLNATLLALVEIPAYLMCLCVLDHPKMGRKRTQFIFFATGGVCLFILMFGLPAGAQTALALTGKFGVAGAFVVVYVLAGEVFPTAVRGTALGLSSGAARVGGMLAPLLVNVLPAGITFAVFGGVSAAAALATLVFNETLGQPTLEVIVEKTLAAEQPPELQGNRT